MKTKGTSISVFAGKIISLTLVMVFFCMIALQSFHHHQNASRSNDFRYKTSITKSEHCKVCDHFVHHKSPALVQHFIFSELNVDISQPVKGGLHLLGNYSALVHCFTNKGPPVAA
ncbi:hypothetical protein QWY86_19275 [Pedobacter aquatilis]|uniref:hypothetical protein n=1 Tax=Pedobacter aquatilis TaxID=351343 RepID=UPI0025B57EC9|nr:hypothetical protein [Pedobacter aquatilis]MDN3588832.1 hypothetical protein [Pedobacter aquatilis]